MCWCPLRSSVGFQLCYGAREADLPSEPAQASVSPRCRNELQPLTNGLCDANTAGALRLLTFPPPRKVLQLPGLVVILSERDVTYRQIFTDGRPLPKDPEPSFNGYSTGRWVKDTLVVETNGLREGWIDRRGSPMTDAARITEKFRRVNYGRLEVEVTVDDPKAYTTPFTVTLNQKILLDTDLLEYHCNDNEKDRAHLVGK